MDTKWKKNKWNVNKKVVGFVSWFVGIILMAVNVSGLLLEMTLHENFTEYAKGVFQGDYEDTEEFLDFVRIRMSDFLAMSVAESGNGEEEKTENDSRHSYGEYSYRDNAYWDNFDWDMEDWEVTEEIIPDIESQSYLENDLFEGSVYQYYNYYGGNYGYGERYDTVYNGNWRMSKEEADEIHSRLQYDKNILYRIEKDGKTLYTNYEKLGKNGENSGFPYVIDIDGESSFVLPDGYNYMMYFDGISLRVWKNGREVKLRESNYELYDDWYIPGYGNIPQDEIYKESRVYMAVAEIPDIIVKRDFDGSGKTYYSNQFYQIYLQTKDIAALYRNWVYSFMVALVLIALGLTFHTERKEAYVKIAGVTGKVWYEIKLFPVLAVIVLFFVNLFSFVKMIIWWEGSSYIYQLFYEIRSLFLYGYGNLKAVMLVAILIICGSILWLFFNDMRYHHKPWENSVIRKIIRLFRTSMLKLPFSKRMIWYSIWVFLIGFLSVLLPLTVFYADRRGKEALLVTFILLLGILFLQVLYVRNMRRMAVDMESLVGQIEAVHGGKLLEDAGVSANCGLLEAMENLKDIRNGMNKAIEEQIKSERMKVELIANVSHDIKTPLTSIISYVELLKQEGGLPEHVKEYISILENKSQRLKAMIQDVFEVSKAASGELPMQMERLDFGKLIHQTIADMQEEIADSAASIKCEIPDGAIMIQADGERLYRVFQNLIQNALKYSLEGSRIYICLKTKDGQAVADIKNTSKEEIPSEIDFTERFVRGDKSRTDGGSGLGLSIAQSFTEACGGRFRVETIADLFVVTVVFEVVSEGSIDNTDRIDSINEEKKME